MEDVKRMNEKEKKFIEIPRNGSINYKGWKPKNYFLFFNQPLKIIEVKIQGKFLNAS